MRRIPATLPVVRVTGVTTWSLTKVVVPRSVPSVSCASSRIGLTSVSIILVSRQTCQTRMPSSRKTKMLSMATTIMAMSRMTALVIITKGSSC